MGASNIALRVFSRGAPPHDHYGESAYNGLRRGQLHMFNNSNIQDVFNAAGVQIMSPNYEADPEHWEGLPVLIGSKENAQHSG